MYGAGYPAGPGSKEAGRPQPAMKPIRDLFSIISPLATLLNRISDRAHLRRLMLEAGFRSQRRIRRQDRRGRRSGGRASTRAGSGPQRIVAGRRADRFGPPVRPGVRDGPELCPHTAERPRAGQAAPASAPHPSGTMPGRSAGGRRPARARTARVPDAIDRPDRMPMFGPGENRNYTRSLPREPTDRRSEPAPTTDRPGSVSTMAMISML
jgi:hypothetical protein